MLRVHIYVDPEHELVAGAPTGPLRKPSVSESREDVALEAGS